MRPKRARRVGVWVILSGRNERAWAAMCGAVAMHHLSCTSTACRRWSRTCREFGPRFVGLSGIACDACGRRVHVLMSSCLKPAVLSPHVFFGRRKQFLMAGIARSRLTEERKSWRRDHPLVRLTPTRTLLSCSLCPLSVSSNLSCGATRVRKHVNNLDTTFARLHRASLPGSTLNQTAAKTSCAGNAGENSSVFFPSFFLPSFLPSCFPPSKHKGLAHFENYDKTSSRENGGRAAWGRTLQARVDGHSKTHLIFRGGKINLWTAFKLWHDTFHVHCVPPKHALDQE